MSNTAFGLVGLAFLFIFLALRMPVAIAMALIGVVGFGLMSGWAPAISMLADEAFVISNNYELIVIPLFILMGNFASTSGMSRDLYNAAYSWFGALARRSCICHDSRVCRFCRSFRVISCFSRHHGPRFAS